MQESIQYELKKIGKLKRIVEDALEEAPEGKIRLQTSKQKYCQYYHVKEEYLEKYPNGKYIAKSQEELIKQLIQKEYNLKVLVELANEEKTLKTCLDSYTPEQLMDIHMQMHEGKRKYLVPHALTDEEYIAQWYKQFDGPPNTAEAKEEYITENQEIVKSKSEKMIADKLFYLGIPYIYEAPLLLDGKYVYPDFTILNVRTRKTYFLEHLGKMGDPDYRKKNLIKIDNYAQNGIVVGKNLLLTMECGEKSFNPRILDVFVREFFV